jgi:hypothetical protein
MQAKAYARSSESEKQNNDRSIIAINGTATFTDNPSSWYDCAYQCELPNGYYSGGYYNYETLQLSADVALKLVLGIVLLTNILLCILSLGYFHHAFNWLFKKEWVKKIYRSSAIVLLLLNGFTLIYDSLYLSVNYYYSSSVIERTGLSFKILATVFMPMLEFLWIIFKVYHCYNHQLGKCKIFFHSVGFCQIIWFAHRLLIDIVISVIFFVIAPAQTIGIITLLLLTILSAIIFFDQMLSSKRNTCIYILIPGSISVVLVVMITLLFITLVDNGVQSSGMGGFVLSIIPPIIALIIGVYVNRENLDNLYQWFRSTTSESDSTRNQTATDSEQVDARPATADGNINEGTHLLYHT